MGAHPTTGGGPKSIPSVVQLPGGIQLKGLHFKIVEHNPDGTPRLFELRPSGEQPPPGPGRCILFADEEWIRRPVPGKSMEGDDRSARCETCEAPATCLGRYEDMDTPSYSCDEHCGHGCEDGECRPLSEVPRLVAKLSEWNDRYQEREATAIAERDAARSEVERLIRIAESNSQAISDAHERSLLMLGERDAAIAERDEQAPVITAALALANDRLSTHRTMSTLENAVIDAVIVMQEARRARR